MSAVMALTAQTPEQTPEKSQESRSKRAEERSRRNGKPAARRGRKADGSRSSDHAPLRRWPGYRTGDAVGTITSSSPPPPETNEDQRRPSVLPVGFAPHAIVSSFRSAS